MTPGPLLRIHVRPGGRLAHPPCGMPALHLNSCTKGQMGARLSFVARGVLATPALSGCVFRSGAACPATWFGHRRRAVCDGCLPASSFLHQRNLSIPRSWVLRIWRVLCFSALGPAGQAARDPPRAPPSFVSRFVGWMTRIVGLCLFVSRGVCPALAVPPFPFISASRKDRVGACHIVPERSVRTSSTAAACMGVSLRTPQLRAWRGGPWRPGSRGMGAENCPRRGVGHANRL